MHTKGHASLLTKNPTQEYGKEHYRGSQRLKTQDIPDLGTFLYPDLFPICLFRMQLDNVYFYDDYIFF